VFVFSRHLPLFYILRSDFMTASFPTTSRLARLALLSHATPRPLNFLHPPLLSFNGRSTVRLQGIPFISSRASRDLFYYFTVREHNTGIFFHTFPPPSLRASMITHFSRFFFTTVKPPSVGPSPQPFLASPGLSLKPSWRFLRPRLVRLAAWTPDTRLRDAQSSTFPRVLFC